MITDVPLVAGELPGRRARGRDGCSSPASTAPRCARSPTPRRSSSTTSAAVFFAFDADEARGIRQDWERYGVRLPLDIVEAPFRDLGDPLRAYLRQITAMDTVAVVVMPELVVHGWRRLLHNQRALYLKRLLLFEPRVILSSVPYRLG